MIEEPDNLVLRYLRRIDEKLDRFILGEPVKAFDEPTVGLDRRMDHVEQRVSRIEKRLDLVDSSL